jgi:uncharacterized protein YidB (DUF937 family)
MNPTDPTIGAEPTASPDASAAGSTMPQVFGTGGVEGVMDQLRGAGYGQHVDSWMSGATPQAIDPAVMHAALGPETVQRISAATGMAPEAVGQVMAQVVPMIVANRAAFTQQGGSGQAGIGELGALLGLFGGAGAMGGMGALGGIFGQLGASQGGTGGIPGMGGAPDMSQVPGMGMPPDTSAPTDSSEPDVSAPPPPDPGSTMTSDLGTITVPGPTPPPPDNP